MTAKINRRAKIGNRHSKSATRANRRGARLNAFGISPAELSRVIYIQQTKYKTPRRSMNNNLLLYRPIVTISVHLNRIRVCVRVYIIYINVYYARVRKQNELVSKLNRTCV